MREQVNLRQVISQYVHFQKVKNKNTWYKQLQNYEKYTYVFFTQILL